MTTTENGTALAVRDRNTADLALRFVIPLDELRQQLVQLEEFKRDIMVEGVDYGTIPGTPKPTLLKPGAEKLTLVFGLAPAFTVSNRIEDWERGFFHYETKCELVSKRTGEIVASAHGSANSKEPRYRWRKAERVCPECNKAAIIKGKAEYGGGWICFDKKGGCKAKFADNDRAITGQVVGNIENPEPYELVNTLLKMAEKRSLVAAALIATGGSGIWTMDIEDMPSVSGEVIDVTPAQAAPAARQPSPANARPNAQPTAARPQNARPAAAAVTTKPTDTKCEKCERMVETEAVRNHALRDFGIPLCIADLNKALEEATGERELPL